MLTLDGESQFLDREIFQRRQTSGVYFWNFSKLGLHQNIGRQLICPPDTEFHAQTVQQVTDKNNNEINL